MSIFAELSLVKISCIFVLSRYLLVSLTSQWFGPVKFNSFSHSRQVNWSATTRLVSSSNHKSLITMLTHKATSH